MIKLINGIKKALRRTAYSLKARLLVVIAVGVLAGVAAFIVLRAAANFGIDNYYNTPEKREEREQAYIEDLQTYVDKNALSSSDNASISRWLEQRKYIYLFVYKDDELFYKVLYLVDVFVQANMALMVAYQPR